MIGLLFALLFDRPPEAFLPCTPGLSVGLVAPTSSVTDTVLGFVEPREPRLCVISRGGRRFAREHLPDRISFAGELDTILAFRPILLKRPLYTGARWRFDEVESTIVGVGRPLATRAGLFTDTVWVEERSSDGTSSVSVYAAGVGLVRHDRGGAAMEAVRIVRP